MQRDATIDTYEANERLGYPADARSYASAKAILDSLGVTKINLMTNNPSKMQALADLVQTVTPIAVESTLHSKMYLRAKKQREQTLAKELHPQLQRLIKQTPEQQSKQTQPAEANQFTKGVRLSIPANCSNLRIGIVKTTWNGELVESLSSQIRSILTQSNVSSTQIFETKVPGSFELPFAAQQVHIFYHLNIFMSTCWPTHFHFR